MIDLSGQTALVTGGSRGSELARHVTGEVLTSAGGVCYVGRGVNSEQ
jgi:NAD(P)-dependent dehydrogenase (short-subunit alcohol dehydrogenase family)